MTELSHANLGHDLESFEQNLSSKLRTLKTNSHAIPTQDNAQGNIQGEPEHIARGEILKFQHATLSAYRDAATLEARTDFLTFLQLDTLAPLSELDQKKYAAAIREVTRWHDAFVELSKLCPSKVVQLVPNRPRPSVATSYNVLAVVPSQR